MGANSQIKVKATVIRKGNSNVTKGEAIRNLYV